MPTIGETLKEARTKQKISIDVAAKAVKVKTEVLEEVEKNDFSSFAAPIYARGILRLYAGFLGLEPESLVEQYNQQAPAPSRRPAHKLEGEEQHQAFSRRRALVISTAEKPSDLSNRGVLGLIIIVVFLGLCIWALSSGGKKSSEAVEPLAPRMVEPSKNNKPDSAVASPLSIGEGAGLNSDSSSATNSEVNISVPALDLESPEKP